MKEDEWEVFTLGYIAGVILILLFFPGCATVHQSDISQQMDTATTFTALELMEGFQEGNPILAPVLELPHYAGYGLLAGAKFGTNYALRNADDPQLCANGIRVTTSLGYTAAMSNAVLITGVVAPPVALVAGIVAGGISAFYNGGFLDECELQEKYPWHDIRVEWENGTLYSNTENYIREPHRLAPVPLYFIPARYGEADSGSRLR